MQEIDFFWFAFYPLVVINSFAIERMNEEKSTHSNGKIEWKGEWETEHS